MFLRLLCRAPTISSQPLGQNGEKGDGETGRRGRRSATAAALVCRLLAASPCRLLPSSLSSPLSPRTLDPCILRFVGTGIAFLPDRYGPVTEPRRLATWSGVPWATICPPLRPAAGPKSSSWSALPTTSRSCSTTSSVLPRSRSFLQGVQQAAVVAGVQADGRLVEHVEHAAQPAAHLGRQADPLHLAAGERGGGPGQRQIFQPHVDQELQPVADLAAHFAGDLSARRR